MRKNFRRLGSLALAAALTLSLCIPALAADNRATAVRDGAFLKGMFTYGPHESAVDLTDNYIYSDDYFKASSYEANEHLATMSMQMAAASISSEDASKYENKSQNVQALLTALGFQRVEVNDCYKQKMDTNTMGAAAAYKVLDDTTVLLAIVPRSAGYEKEWGGNFNVGSGSGDESSRYTTDAAGFQGTDGLHAGFQAARNIVLDFAKGYVSTYADAFAGKTVKVWTVGYSRGGATANLIGAAIADDAQNAIGVEVKPENLYAYTFGTPATVQTTTGERPSDAKYNGIHNYFADYDPVTMAPFSAWGFTRYGQDVTYNASSRKSRMLQFLQAVNPNVYNIYTAAAGTGDPDNFKGYTLGEGLTLTPSGETTSQRAFLQERIKHLTETVADTREIYNNNYQAAISTLAGFYLGDSRADGFVQGISAPENRTKLTQLVLLLAFYDWAEEYQDSAAPDSSQAALALKDALPEAGSTGYLASDEYKALRDKVTDGASLTSYLTASNAEKSEYIRQTETLMKEILTAGFDAAGMDENDAVRTTALSDVAVSGLTKFISYFVFGTDATLSQIKSSESVGEAVKNALIQKINTAATLVGNAGTYMRVHNNEVILSWLRTMDSYYDDPIVDDTDDSEPIYAVRTSVMEHGAVSISARYAERGDRVTLTVTPDDGYELDTLTAIDGKGNVITLTDSGSGKYVFTMQGSRVTVSAVFREKWVGPAYESFSDLKDDVWYRDGVEYALKHDLMRGVSDSLFMPNGTTSRAMAITVLWRAAGSPVVNYAVSFSDVTAGSWYAEAVAWAASEGIVTGYTDGRFGVGDTVTREQLAAMLYRYAQKNGVDISVGENTNILSYDDAASVAAYAVPAMQWACGSGVINGSASPSGGMRLDPQGSATRAQLATMLMRFGKCTSPKEPQ